MPGKLKLLTCCLLLAGLTLTIVLLSDSRASQQTTEPAAETTTVAEETTPEITLTIGPMLQGPMLVAPSAPYGNSPTAEEEPQQPATEEDTVQEEPVQEDTVQEATEQGEEQLEHLAFDNTAKKAETPETDETEEDATKDEADKVDDGATDEDATEEDAEENDAEKDTEEKDAEPAKPLRQLSPEMTTLRDRVRRTLATYHQQTFNTRQNTATDVMNLCLAFGCNTQVYRSDVRQKVNGITCLCWNYPCAGYETLAINGDHIGGRIGYGLQTHPSQLLAVLALSRVPADYPIRVGEDVRTVADLIESEKLSCRDGSDMSLKLLGLAYYMTKADATWKNDRGETWSVKKIIKNELDADMKTATAGGTLRLLGLGYAVGRRVKREQPMEGQYKRAQAFVSQYINFALELQNADGSWGPNFLATRGPSRDKSAALRSTGHILGWLAVSLPEENLTDPRIVRAVTYVNRALSSRTFQANLKNGGQRHMETIMHALHGLAEYDRRWFKPADPLPEPKPEPTPEAKPAAVQQAAR